jgi:flagellar hook assembly protein FlgD
MLVSSPMSFHQYLAQLDQVSNVEQWEPAEQLAFWMNVYNALCINIILQHESKNDVMIGSITDLSQDNRPVWDQVAGKVAGVELSLNGIEHDKLRESLGRTSSTWL